MTREPDAIQADIDALDGKKGSGVKKGQLKVELIASLRAEIDALRCDKIGTATITSDSDGDINYVAHWDVSPLQADPLNSDEWKFIEGSLADLSVDVRSGSTSGMMKNIYHQLMFKVKMWRIVRKLVMEFGADGEWPSFAALKVNASTGDPIVDKPKPVPVESTAMPDTPKQMPMRSKAPSAAEIMGSVTGGDPRIGMRADIESRPEPVRAGPV